MKENVAFLMKDLILMAVSFYLLRQDVLRVAQSTQSSPQLATAQLQHNPR
jgi:hypothetical protein